MLTTAALVISGSFAGCAEPRIGLGVFVKGAASDARDRRPYV
jgi:hypothetical protein